MTLDYDVVIIGGSIAARYAALNARQLRATVALVEPKSGFGFIHHQAMGELAKLAQALGNAAKFGINTEKGDNRVEKHEASVAWEEALFYVQEVSSNHLLQHSPAILAAEGIDVIVGSGQFQASPDFGFFVNNRLLKGRTYLLAASVPAIPNIDGLQKTGYFTPSNIWQSRSESAPPKNSVIIGGVPQTIEMAQTLARLGCSVTLIVNHPYILPDIDPEIAQLLQAQLEVDGVNILTDTIVTQVRRIDDKKWIQAGDKAIETDEIIVATKQQPNSESLNLAAVGVKCHNSRVLVNEKLQTTNPRIYACGDVIGGYDIPNIANYEAKIALKNALFFPRLKVDYRCVPWAMFTQPTLAQVGLTEVQAKDRYRHNQILVLRQYFKSLAAAQLQDNTTGICKLIVLRNGEILGASILGTEAGELINIIALAISQKISVKYLADLSPVYPSFSEILSQTAQLWNQHKLNSNFALEEFLDDFFQFRRDWNV